MWNGNERASIKHIRRKSPNNFILTIYVFGREQNSRSVSEVTRVRAPKENYVDRLLLRRVQQIVLKVKWKCCTLPYNEIKFSPKWLFIVYRVY